MELTDKIDYSTCEKIYSSVQSYGEKSANCSTVRRLRKKDRYIVVKRVNTPEKIPALYIYIFKKKGGFTWFSFVELKGSEGSSFLCNMAQSRDYVIIKSHLISRFMERHGWSGDRQSCEEYILMKSFLLWYDTDKVTGEINAYFDGGMFLGHQECNIKILSTYIDESIMHKNQKIKAKWQELKLRDSKRVADLKYNPSTKFIIDCFDEIKMETRMTIEK